MKNLTINNAFDNPDLTSRKARLISIINNKILICNYSGFYMLPGGKLDKDETFTEAIIREIHEETGNVIAKEDIEPYIKVDNYQQNYYSRSCPENPISKKTTTVYFDCPKKIINQEAFLSPLEKSGNMHIAYMDIEELKNLLKEEIRPKNLVFAQELVKVLQQYEMDHKPIDLHTHTTFSDGEYTPDEVINKARQKNIGVIAITDHDNIEALKNIDYDKYDDIKVLPGVELTAKVPKGRMHILGYLIDYYNPELNQALNTMRTNSINKLKNMVEYLIYLGLTFKEEDLNAIYNQPSNIGRPDLARLLIKYNYVQDLQEAFDKYLVEAFNKSRSKINGYTYEQILNIIRKAHGISILAHPTSLELNHAEFEDLLQDMIKCGVMGLEVFHPNVPETEREFYMDMVNKYKLLYSVGSDFHGEHIKENFELGRGRGDILCCDASLLQYIKRHESN